ncbi:RNA-binding protein RO60 [Eucyclogobius newberryi]|uniref:RNA-binding protein RO60 n=1 Tax=Eucyclogobius newberryi TaxID=166745 RepID=UPI003B5A3E7D
MEKNHDMKAQPWEVDDKARLCRFLCYGSEGDIYTAREEVQVSRKSAEALLALLEDGRGAEVVEVITRYSQDGRAVSVGPCLFALAVCSQHSDLKTRQAAFKALKEVCQDPGCLFAFIQYKKELKDSKNGIWGRALRKAVSNWYNGQNAMSLAASVAKCKRQNGWSHQDLLKLSHAKPANDGVALICKYIMKGWKEVKAEYADRENPEEVLKALSYLEVLEKVKHSSDETEVITMIEEHALEEEQLLTDHLKSKNVWKALLKEMPLQLLMKRLGKMTAKRILEPGSSDTQTVCDRIQNDAILKKGRIHPFSILVALENYKKGQGYQGKTKWETDSNIIHAMDSAFYKTFTHLEPVDKNLVIAVDISTSLSSVVPGTSVSTAVAAAAITMVFASTEANTQVLAYSGGSLVPCSVAAGMTLEQVTAELVKTPSESTDCTLPMAWATENKKAVDIFIIMTNNPIWAFSASPVEALKRHRQKMGTFSKFVMCGLTSNGHAVADKPDRGVLSICGFDLGAITLIRNMALGLI